MRNNWILKNSFKNGGLFHQAYTCILKKQKEKLINQCAIFNIFQAKSSIAFSDAFIQIAFQDDIMINEFKRKDQMYILA